MEKVSSWRQTSSSLDGSDIEVSQFGEVPYLLGLQAMQDFVVNRATGDADQIWLLQHPQVYTQGTACQQQPLAPTDIPLVKSDRGGQITFHGPGQVVMYPMLRLKRYSIGVKAMVNHLEQAAITTLDELGIKSTTRDDAPGVYVNEAKIAALGLRIRKGTSYHGLSLNMDMDLSPFLNIDPCGYQGLKVTQIADQGSSIIVNSNQLGKTLVNHFIQRL